MRSINERIFESNRENANEMESSVVQGLVRFIGPNTLELRTRI